MLLVRPARRCSPSQPWRRVCNPRARPGVLTGSHRRTHFVARCSISSSATAMPTTLRPPRRTSSFVSNQQQAQTYHGQNLKTKLATLEKKPVDGTTGKSRCGLERCVWVMCMSECPQTAKRLVPLNIGRAYRLQVRVGRSLGRGPTLDPPWAGGCNARRHEQLCAASLCARAAASTSGVLCATPAGDRGLTSTRQNNCECRAHMASV